MFCSKCGKQIADDSRFCPECGNGIGTNSVLTERPQYAAPDYETKVEEEGGIDRTVEKLISLNQIFSWKVLSTQKVVRNGASTVHTDHYGGSSSSTIINTDYSYSVITFQRDRNLPWYAEMKNLEEEYYSLKAKPSPDEQCPLLEDSLLYHGNVIHYLGCFAGVFIEIMYWCYFIITVPITIAVNLSRRKKALKYREENYDKFMEVYQKDQQRMAEIISIAEKLPNSYR